MKPLSIKFPNIYFESKGKGRMTLFTENLIRGKSVYGERLVRIDGREYREWDPTRSKLSAAIMQGISQIGMKQQDTILYLGASSGTTPSHVSDIVGRDGFIYALDFAPRVVRNLVFVCESRKNMAPILADANQPKTFRHLVTAADFIYQDIAQKNQSEIFLKNCDMFLKKGGFAMLCVKARSIDVTKKPKEIFQKVRQELEREIAVVDYKVLDPYEKDHCVYICKK